MADYPNLPPPAPDPLLEAAQAVLDEVAAACPHIALPVVRVGR